jgi:hypothetical protein
MVSTYTSNKAHLEKPAAGDYVGTWATPVNADWDVLDAALGGTATASLAGGDWTASTSDAQALRLIPTGILTANRNIVLPAGVGGFWLVTNSTTGAFTVTVKTATGGSTGPTVPQGYTSLVYSDGIDVKLGDGGPLSLYLPLAGGTMTGSLALPSNGLNVGSGQLRVTGGNVTASGDITATGNVTGYSDARLKTNVKTIASALAMVNEMRGVRYKMHGRDGIGVIAQELERVLPELVHSDPDGVKSVAYANIVGVLIEAIKELSLRVERLEHMVEPLG